jgi:hypothetical protein
LASKVKQIKIVNNWDSLCYDRYIYDSTGKLIKRNSGVASLYYNQWTHGYDTGFGKITSFHFYDSINRLDFIHIVGCINRSCDDPTVGDSTFVRIYFYYDSANNLIEYSDIIRKEFHVISTFGKVYNYNNNLVRSELIIPYFVDDTLFKYKRVMKEQSVYSPYKDTFYYSKPHHFIQLPDIYVCQGDSVKNMVNILKQKEFHQIKYLNRFRCDSIYKFNLKLKPTFEITEDDSVCVGDSLLWRGKYYSTAGTYYKNYNTYLNCDSTYVLNLKIIQPPKPEQIITNPVNGILKDGGLGEIILPRTNVSNSYFTAIDSLQYSGIYKGNGVHLSLGNFYQEGTYGIWAFKKYSGCKAKIGEVVFTQFSSLNHQNFSDIFKPLPPTPQQANSPSKYPTLLRKTSA